MTTWKKKFHISSCYYFNFPYVKCHKQGPHEFPIKPCIISTWIFVQFYYLWQCVICQDYPRVWGTTLFRAGPTQWWPDPLSLEQISNNPRFPSLAFFKFINIYKYIHSFTDSQAACTILAPLPETEPRDQRLNLGPCSGSMGSYPLDQGIP